MKTLRALIASLIAIPRSMTAVAESLDSASANLRESNEAVLMTLKVLQGIQADMERCWEKYAEDGRAAGSGKDDKDAVPTKENQS